MCNLAEKRHFAKKRHLADFLLFQKSVTWQMRQLAEKLHFYKKKNKIWKCEQIFGQMTPFLGRNDAFFWLKRYFYRELFVRNWTAGATGSNNSDSETKLPRKCYSCSSSRWNKSKVKPFRWLRNRRALSATIYGQIAKWFPSISARVSKVDSLPSQTKTILKFVVTVSDRCVINRSFSKPFMSKVNFQVPITILVKVLRQIQDFWFGTVENGTVVSTVGFSEDRKKLQRPIPNGQLFLVVKFISITKMPLIRCTVLVTFLMKLLKICNWTDQAIVNILAGWLSSYELRIKFS